MKNSIYKFFLFHLLIPQSGICLAMVKTTAQAAAQTQASLQQAILNYKPAISPESQEKINKLNEAIAHLEKKQQREISQLKLELLIEQKKIKMADLKELLKCVEENTHLSKSSLLMNSLEQGTLKLGRPCSGCCETLDQILLNCLIEQSPYVAGTVIQKLVDEIQSLNWSINVCRANCVERNKRDEFDYYAK